MNSKIYRCGYCGLPVYENGSELPQEKFFRVVHIIEKYSNSGKHTHLTHGDCCAHEQNNEHNMVEITRDMAIDAGDRSLEGQWVVWK